MSHKHGLEMHKEYSAADPKIMEAALKKVTERMRSNNEEITLHTVGKHVKDTLRHWHRSCTTESLIDFIKHMEEEDRLNAHIPRDIH